MKTKIISKLKKGVLIIEMPNVETEMSIGLHCIGVKPPPIGKDASDTNGYYHIYKEMFHGYTLLGSPDEINEEDVIELVDNKGNYYKNYSPIHGSVQGNITFNALESFHSALESEIYWDVNPKKFGMYAITPTGIKDTEYYDWNEAQGKTFDRNRTLIFVKN